MIGILSTNRIAATPASPMPGCPSAWVTSKLPTSYRADFCFRTLTRAASEYVTDKVQPEGAIRPGETFAYSSESGNRAGEYERDHGFLDSHVNSPCISILALDDEGEGSPEDR